MFRHHEEQVEAKEKGEEVEIDKHPKINSFMTRADSNGDGRISL
jgi:hypothetical protein